MYRVPIYKNTVTIARAVAIPDLLISKGQNVPWSLGRSLKEEHNN
jgi:hypothetical protein